MEWMQLRMALGHHVGERRFTEAFETALRTALTEKGCPPCEFLPPEGQKGALLRLRDALWDAIGEQREIGAVLAAVLPLWQFGENELGLPTFLVETGVWDWGRGEHFEISWIYQEMDEESDEFFQLCVTLRYEPDGENRQFHSADWLEDSAAFGESVRNSEAFRWAEGREADEVTVDLRQT